MLVQRPANSDRVPGLRALEAACSEAARITVAVIDAAADLTHPALAGSSLVVADDAVRLAAMPVLGRAHGTEVASILFGRPGGPVAGLVPRCRGILVPVFPEEADGTIRPCSEIELSRAIRLALELGAQVINISAGRISRTGTAGAHLNDAVRHCIEAGAVVVAAAGNDGCDCLQVPAALPGVIAVGAMDAGGEPVGFSNWGAAYRERGVLAPGTDVLAAGQGGGAVRRSGTSFAAPFVTGTAALLMATMLAAGRDPDGRTVTAAILDGAEACDIGAKDNCERFLAGRLDVAGALDRVRAALRGGIRPSSREIIERGREEMDEELAGAGATGTSGPGPAFDSVAASLRSMEAAIAALAQSVAAIRPAAAPGAAPEVAPPMPAVRRPGRSAQAGILPAACCDACAAREARQLVFALGKVGYDFGTEARMDSIQSQLESRIRRSDRRPSVSNPADLVEFLRLSPAHSPAITWTLNLDEAPIYAIRPEGDYLEETYEFLVEVLDEQTRSAMAAAAPPPPAEGAKPSGRRGAPPEAPPPPPPVERMSLPGVINGEVILMNGNTVPTVRPALGGMFTWSTEALVEALGKLTVLGPNDAGKEGPFNPADGLRTFLNRIYEEVRNVGLAPQDRALNFAATNAYQANDIFVKLRGRNIHIEKFEVVRSPVMRPESDCWDVKMTFFNPADPRASPREVYFYTIDVSDVVPVAIGRPRHWTTF